MDDEVTIKMILIVMRISLIACLSFMFNLPMSLVAGEEKPLFP